MKGIRCAVLVLASGLGLVGCPHRRLVVPNTPEAGACQRECMLVQHDCLRTEALRSRANGEDGSPEWAQRIDCQNEQQRCLSTCPGAYYEAIPPEGGAQDCQTDQDCAGMKTCSAGRCVSAG